MTIVKEHAKAAEIPLERTIEIFRMGMENQVYLDQWVATKKPIALYYLACLVLCKYQPVLEPTVAFLNGKHQYKLYQKSGIKQNPIAEIRHGRFFSSVQELRTANTIYSGMTRSNRIRLLFRGMREYKVHMLGRYGSLWDWLEFSCIRLLLEQPAVQCVVSFGHYDRYTTWISHLSHALNKQLEIHQHGAEGIKTLPHRVYCSKLFCFNETEQMLFKSIIIMNTDCEYTITGFISNVVFETFKNDGVPFVGIVGQWNPEDCIVMARGILQLLPAAQVVIMPHPGETKAPYDTLLAGAPDERILVEFVKRYGNLDVLIAICSSLVYDYVAHGYNNVIVAVKNDELSYEIQSEKYYIAPSIEAVPGFVKQALDTNTCAEKV